MNVLTPRNAERPPEAGAQLAVLLGEVFADLTRLKVQADRMCAEQPGGGRARTGGIQALRPTLIEGRAAISRRLEELGRPLDPSREPVPDPCQAAEGTGTALTAYGPCFDRLGRALREARRIADVPTTAILGHLIVRLEKHLWLFDLPLTDGRVLDWSNVNLFSLC